MSESSIRTRTYWRAGALLAARRAPRAGGEQGWSDQGDAAPGSGERVARFGLTRRRVLVLLGVFGVTQGLNAACSATAAAPTPAPTAPPKSTAAPAPTTAPAGPTTAPAAAAKPTAAAAATAAAPQPAANASPAAATGPAISLKTGYSNIDPDFLALYLAEDAGLYKRHGLDVNEVLVSGGANTMASVLSGEIKLGAVGGSEVLSATANGADLLTVATLTPWIPYELYVVAEIKTVDDLKGKKVGVSNFGGSADIATREGLRQLGIDPDKDVTMVAVGSHAARTSALLSGAIQCGADNPPGSYKLEDNGAHVLVDLADKKIPFANTTITGSREWITGNKEATQRYVDSVVDSFAYMRKNKEAAVQSMMKAYKSKDEAMMSKAFDHYVAKLAPTQPFPRPDQFQVAQKQEAQKNPKIGEIDLNKILDPSFVQSAVDRGLAAA